jgi:hypothetical protein
MERSQFDISALTSALRRQQPTTLALMGAWLILLGSYSIVSLTVTKGPGLTTYGDTFQCLAALFACVGLLMNSFSTERRTRAFWLLMAFGCAAWLVGQLIWTYFEVVRRQNVPNPFIGDGLWSPGRPRPGGGPGVRRSVIRRNAGATS